MLAAALDHLWQSTLVALAAGLLAAGLRKAPAGARYGVWFAASAKFLIPFAALMALGRALAPRLGAPRLLASMGLPPAHATPEAALIQTAAQPFAESALARQPLAGFPFDHAAGLPAPAAPVHAGAAPVIHAAGAAALHLDPVPVLAAVWALGSLAVLVRWARRSAKVRAAVRSARPLAWPASMPVKASASLMEPGLVGFVSPVLLVPETLPGRLSRSEIEAIVAHEACHLRRRDNLTAAAHMLVEALFWFHPLVWWIGARLIAERERACDEAVVRAGHDRGAYARSLVESCRLYLQSPLDCVAGASGSNLKDRVEAIMTAAPARPLSGSRKAVLLALGACTCATPVAAGLVTAPAGPNAAAPAVLAAVLAPAHSHAILAARPAPAAIALTQLQAAILPPALAVAQADVAPPQPDAAAPQIDLAQAAPAPGAAAPPSLTPVESAAPPAGLEPQVSAFIQSYGGAFWNTDRPLCIRVEGLPADKADEVKARVTADARAAGISVGRAECGQRFQIEIRFAADAGRAVDDVLDYYRHPIWPFPMEKPAGADRPIRAWYGIVYDSAGLGGLDGAAPYARDLKKFDLAIVVVDPARTQGLSIDAVSDYVAMLALAQPRALDRCNVLPSITDLFAGACPGRPIPTGLTPADDAFLKALYTGSPGLRATRYPSELARRMADILGASRAIASPAPAVAKADAAPAAAPKSANPAADAARFVQTYGAFGSGLVAARWRDPICLRIEGVASNQAAAVRARIAQVARALGVGVAAAGCAGADVEIAFTQDPQGVLDEAVKRQPRVLGDATGTGSETAVTLPVQAWYLTNGGQYASAGGTGLKVLADWQTPFPLLQDHTVVPYSPGLGPDDFPRPGAIPPDSGPNATRRLRNVLVIVDLRRTGDSTLATLTDYVAMLGLSEPRALGRCQALPSITDLFAGPCPGREAPQRLTPADIAYLTALYTVRPSLSRIARRMAEVLPEAERYRSTPVRPDRLASR